MSKAAATLLFAASALAAVFAAAPADETPSVDTIAAQIKQNRGRSLSVLELGAKGDGQTDDTTALQQIIDAPAGSIRFPAGTYRITQPLVVDLNRVGFTSFTADGTAQLRMDGPGPAIRFVGNHASSADPNTFKPEVWQRQRMPVVEGLAIVGNHAEADGIAADGTMQLTLRGVHIRKCRHGVHLVNRNRNILIDACHIYENSGSGIYYDHVDLHQSNISASHISYCDQGGIVVRGGNVRNIHIAGCDIEANMAKDGPPAANVLLDCADGSVAEVAITGCTIQHTKEAPGSANIRILGRGTMNRRNEKQAFNCGNVTIGDNVLSDVQTNIHLDGVQGVTINGNTLWQGYDHNILIEDSSHVLIGPNMLQRNPLYAYTAAGKDNVVLKGSRDCTIQGLHLHNVTDSEAGLTLEKCDRVHVVGCTILDCDNAGLLIKHSQDIHYESTFISDRRPGATSVRVKAIDADGKVLESK